ncbi:MAG: PAS domain S-box protein, partial [Candidatus Cloacimonadota bacterium]|nr:PAS domain S-box protein [Candidatus Cloacimonadota bacterium]
HEFENHSERILLNKDGKKIKILKSVTPIIFDGNECLLENFVDLTASKDKETKLAQLLDTISTGVREIDLDFNIISANKRFSEMTGLPLIDIIGKKCFNIFGGDSCHTEKCYLTQFLNGRKNRVSEDKIKIKPNNEEISVNISSTALTDNDGKIIGIVEDFRDVTYLKKHQNELRESETSFKEIFSNAPGAITIQNEKGIILNANNSAEKLYGYSKNEFINNTKEMLLAPEINDLNEVEEYIKKAFLGYPQKFEIWVQNKKGDIFLIIARISTGYYFGEKVLFAFNSDITEQKRREKELLILKYALNSTNDGVSITDAKGKNLYRNESLHSMFGYDYQEFNVINISDLYVDKTILNQVLENYMLGEKGDYDVEMVKKNGENINVNLKTNMIRDDQDKEVGVIAIHTDITDRLINIKKIEESEQYLKSIFNAMNEIIIEIDRNGKYIDLAPTNQEFFYKNRDLMIGKTVYEILPQEVAKQIHEKIIESLDTQKITTTVYPLTIDNKKLWFSAKFSSKTKDTIIAFITDITKQKLEQIKLKKLSYAITQSPALTMLTDLDGNIEYVNPKFTEITGYTFDEVKGKNPRILKSDEMEVKFYKDLWETITDGKNWHGEFCNINRNGELFWETASISPIFDNEGKTISYIKISEDITVKKKMESKIIQSQKMDSIGNLASGVAHDFNNLLTVINGYSEIGSVEALDNEQLSSYFLEISSAGKRAQGLVDQLLTFSRRQRSSPKLIDPQELIYNADKMLNRLIEADIKLSIKLDDNVGSITADPVQFDQILMNFVVNARDAINMAKNTTSDNKICVMLKSFYADEKFCKLNEDFSEGKYALLSVSDNGMGMSIETQHKIFEPFFTTKEVGEGTGLGLSTVFGIVKQNNAIIEVESQIGDGTTFFVYWPISDKVIETVSKKKFDVNTYSGTETILFAEDEAIVRTVGVALLRKIGYKILVAENGLVALELAKKEKNISLLMTDLVMPEMDGYELSQKIYEFMPDIKILFTSGYPDEKIYDLGLNKSLIHFIPKPYSLKKLAVMIKEILVEDED